MTDRRFAAVAALLAIASLAACKAAAPGGDSATDPAKAAETAAPTLGPAGAAATPAGANASLSSGTFTGSVVETMNSGGYTYLRLRGGKDGKEEIWVAAGEFPAKMGERLSAVLEMRMDNFHSTSLNRDFPVIYFVPSVSRDGEVLTGGGAPAAGAGTPMDMMGSHGTPAAAAAPTPVEPVSPAPGGLKIAEVWAQRAKLGGKPVVVRGKVVKVNYGIMDLNWVHLQDGSGLAKDRTNDLTVTTTAEVKVGEIVTMTGVLAADKDFGSGYAYDALLENAKVTGK